LAASQAAIRKKQLQFQGRYGTIKKKGNGGVVKIERTKNASRNILFGVILKLLQIVLPFVMRTAILYCMGEEYLGLNSLFAQILQVLNLAELGVGSAMVFSMYKPIAEDDEQTICALMRLYKIYYRIIGTVIGVLGFIILPLLPYLIKDAESVPVNIYLLFSMNVVQTICSYWLFGYKNCLLSAHQRTDITSKVT
jgi:O-antigen/teichoic acid export membrane protein